MRRFAMLILSFAVSSCLLAQQSLFESGDGRTSLYIKHTTAGINLGDSKASFGYIHNHSVHPVLFGAGLYATASSGAATLFSGDKPKAPEGGFSGFIGFRHDPKPADCPTGQPSCPFKVKNNRFLLDAGYGRSSFYLYPTGILPTGKTQKTNFDRFRTVAAWNLFYNGNILVGLAGGAERRNNTGDLTSANLQNTLVPAPTGGSGSVVHNQAGFYGNYKVYVAAPVYQDFLFYLPTKPTVLGKNNTLGIDLLSRSDLAAVNRGALGGIGIFLFDKDDPFKTLGGVTATYDGTKFQLSLTAGFTIQ